MFKIVTWRGGGLLRSSKRYNHTGYIKSLLLFFFFLSFSLDRISSDCINFSSWAIGISSLQSCYMSFHRYYWRTDMRSGFDTDVIFTKLWVDVFHL